MADKISYPYLPKGRTIEYVSADDFFMRLAQETARMHSLDRGHPTGTVIVDGLDVIGCGANGSDFHEKHGCERKRLNIPTGQGYELCEGCHPKNHSEPRAIDNAQQKGHNTAGTSAYLWGHWWICEPCWKRIIEAEIPRVYLMEGSERLFNNKHPDNIIGKLFEN